MNSELPNPMNSELPNLNSELRTFASETKFQTIELRGLTSALRFEVWKFGVCS